MGAPMRFCLWQWLGLAAAVCVLRAGCVSLSISLSLCSLRPYSPWHTPTVPLDGVCACAWLSSQRWVFPEPSGVLGYPRQRVRREMEKSADWHSAEKLMMSSLDEEDAIAPHNRNSLVFKVGPAQAEEWAANGLKTQNQVLDKVPPLTGENSMFTSLNVWLRMIEAAHGQGTPTASSLYRTVSAVRFTHKVARLIANTLPVAHVVVVTVTQASCASRVGSRSSGRGRRRRATASAPPSPKSSSPSLTT